MDTVPDITASCAVTHGVVPGTFATQPVNSSADTDSKMLTILSVNATSLAKKGAVESLATEALYNNIDVIAICETWFTSQMTDSLLNINGYKMFRIDRNNRKGGGVCFYVKDSICCKHFVSVCPKPNVEIIWICVTYYSLIYYVACCYYPPNPCHTPDDFICCLSVDLDRILGDCENSVIIVLGDFNQHNTSYLENQFGLVQCVNDCTHGSKLLDKFFCSHPFLYKVGVYKSCLKTKHRAVLATGLHHCTGTGRSVNARKKFVVFDLRASFIDRLRYLINGYDWNQVYDCTDIDIKFQLFVDAMLVLMSRTIPAKVVRLGKKDPYFVTPLVRSLLNRRRILRRRGRLAEADALSDKINTIISAAHSESLKKLSSSSSRVLWSHINPKYISSTATNTNFTADVLNDFFAKISTGPPVSSDVYCGELSYIEKANFSELYIESILRRLKSTSSGWDGLPSWLFRKCSVELASVVAHLINSSINLGTVPDVWRTAIVTPVPKVSHPVSPGEFRPISVTPILSRITEKLIVKSWLYPAIPLQYLGDQYGFRPTGSTTAALIDIFHSVTRMLEHSSYVRALLIDFSKAFDIVDHRIIMNKLAMLHLPDNIYNWIGSFLSNRRQVCRHSETVSSIANFNCGFIQGSGLGPTLYIILALDLKTLSKTNKLVKFADDSSLLVPQGSDIDLLAEFRHIQAWASSNSMVINLAKTKEIVFFNPRSISPQPPIPLSGIQQVESAKLLGIYVQNNFCFELHFKHILTVSSQRLHILKVLKRRGLCLDLLHGVFHALIVTKLTYAISAWYSFLTRDQLHQIDSLFKRAYTYGYVKCLLTIDQLCSNADLKLFHKSMFVDHCMHHLLPSIKATPYNLRKTGHSFCVGRVSSELHKRTFVNRMVFSDCY